VGLDAYKHVLQSDVDVVILATPPGFRPLHFEAAVRAGKHVFVEKPVAVDAAGIRQVLATNEEAKRQGLAVVVGLQRRHEPRYQETVQRLQDGAIGDILLARAYWNGPGMCVRPRTKEQTELEYQMRNWYHFSWLSGDHLVEQHVHNLDVINWVKGAYPVEANGQGGRQTRSVESTAPVFDHHFVEFTYADGSKMFSQCRQNKNCWNCVSEHVHGARGTANISSATIRDGQGDNVWRYGRGGGGGHQRLLDDLFADLREGRIPNEGDYGAWSTMTAILGRMATCSGQSITMHDALNCTDIESPVDQITSLKDTPPELPVRNEPYVTAINARQSAVRSNRG
jgi:myo-inositol 2-dehydrogenase/D-chiro-inositol 1-dehydrogenase